MRREQEQLFLVSVNGHLLGTEWASSEREACELASRDYGESASQLVARPGRHYQQSDDEDEEE